MHNAPMNGANSMRRPSGVAVDALSLPLASVDFWLPVMMHSPAGIPAEIRHLGVVQPSLSIAEHETRVMSCG